MEFCISSLQICIYIYIHTYSDTLESELNTFQNPVRVLKQSPPFEITKTQLIRSKVPQIRISKRIITANAQDIKIKYQSRITTIDYYNNELIKLKM